MGTTRPDLRLSSLEVCLQVSTKFGTAENVDDASDNEIVFEPLGAVYLLIIISITLNYFQILQVPSTKSPWADQPGTLVGQVGMAVSPCPVKDLTSTIMC